jgi:hypothetical protein
MITVSEYLPNLNNNILTIAIGKIVSARTAVVSPTLSGQGISSELFLSLIICYIWTEPSKFVYLLPVIFKGPSGIPHKRHTAPGYAILLVGIF